MTFTPEQLSCLGLAIALMGGLVFKYWPKLLSVLGCVEVSGKVDERRVADPLGKDEHDEICGLKLELLAQKITGPIDIRLTAIEAHEKSASEWVRDIDTKVDRLLARKLA
jgi:hypothetical protein